MEMLQRQEQTRRRVRPPRYGMAWSTIRYWQQTAADRQRYYGAGLGYQTFLASAAHPIATVPSRRIAHEAIQAAYINPERLKNVLTTGKRGDGSDDRPRSGEDW